MLKKIGAGFSALTLLAFFSVAQAAGTYDAITTAVNWADVITGIVAVAALVAAVLVVQRGASMLLRAIKR